MEQMELDSGREFVELLELQGSSELITRSALLEHVRKRGGHVSPRTLTFYATEELIPKAVRVGSRGGVYPVVVADLLLWIVESRDRGISIDAIRELLPIWKFLYRAFDKFRLELGELEYLVRQHVSSLEAVFWMPALVPSVGSGICSDCMSKVVMVRKDGSEVPVSASVSEPINFLLYRPETEDEPARFIDTVPVTFPVVDVQVNEDAPNSVIVGIPLGVTPPPQPAPGSDRHPLISAEPHKGAGDVEGGDK